MLKAREDFYIKLIKESCSYCEVCRKANIVPTSGNYQTLKNVVKNNNIDISHFKRQGGKKGVKPYTLDEVLNNKRQINSHRLGKMLIKYGLKERKCENPECGLTEWHGKPINVVPHHINGNHNDNRLENIIFLCHNCHSYTENFSGKNQKNKMPLKKNSYKTNNVKQKETTQNQKTIDKDKKIPLIIESLKRTRSFSGTAREFGVSDNAIRKLLFRRGYPKYIKQLLEFIDKTVQIGSTPIGNS